MDSFKKSCFFLVYASKKFLCFKN